MVRSSNGSSGRQERVQFHRHIVRIQKCWKDGSVNRRPYAETHKHTNAPTYRLTKEPIDTQAHVQTHNSTDAHRTEHRSCTLAKNIIPVHAHTMRPYSGTLTRKNRQKSTSTHTWLYPHMQTSMHVHTRTRTEARIDILEHIQLQTHRHRRALTDVDARIQKCTSHVWIFRWKLLYEW